MRFEVGEEVDRVNINTILGPRQVSGLGEHIPETAFLAFDPSVR